MKLKRPITPYALPLLAAALLAGCATRLPPGRPAYVYVAENTAITFNGDTFMQVDELPKRLLKAGVTPENEIFLILQGDVPDVYLKSLIYACGRSGLPNVIVREKIAPTSYAQEIGAGVKPPAGATPPRMVVPGAKRTGKRGSASDDDWGSAPDAVGKKEQ